MGRHPAKQRPRSLSPEISMGQTTGRADGLLAEPGIQPKMSGNAQRGQRVFCQLIPSFNEVRKQRLVISAVFAKSAGRLLYGGI